MTGKESAIRPLSLVPRDEREQLRDQLELRLVDGDIRISHAEQQGLDVRAWEEFWLNLLTEYVAICDSLLLEEAA